MGVNALSMLMPKAASHFDDLLEPRKDEVGLAGKVRNVESIPEPHAMNQTAYDHFRLHAPTFDPAHVLTATIRRNRIHRESSLSGHLDELGCSQTGPQILCDSFGKWWR